MIGNKALPKSKDLMPYSFAVAGHDGTLCDQDGVLFIKPCTQQEIDFYETANKDHQQFADLMPTYMGTLSLNEATEVSSINEQLPAVADHISEEMKEHVIRDAKAAAAEVVKPKDNIRWQPNKNRKIATSKSVVLENAAYGYSHPNILDAKLGSRLWADDAPLEKRQRFDEISRQTTNGSHGFRIAGMRVYKGSENPEELDSQGYKIYDKDYGRLQVTPDNVVDEMRKFIFNSSAGVDEDLGRAVASVFVENLKRVERVLANEESRMYSASLLFTFEGDGEALRAAIEKENAMASAATSQTEETTEEMNARIAEKIVDSQPGRTATRVDSGIVLDDEGQMVLATAEGEFKDIEAVISGQDLRLSPTEEKVLHFDLEDEDSDDDEFPKIFSLKLIDFAHAEWTPGQGPDENCLKGVRSLIKIFEELSHGLTASTTRTIALQPLWEWRFEVPHSNTSSSGITVRLVSGSAERDGTELALNKVYTFGSGCKSKLLTWHGCTLEVTDNTTGTGGGLEDYVAQSSTAEETPQVSYLNLHFALQAQRQTAATGTGRQTHQQQGQQQQQRAKGGPRVMVCGPQDTGKTSLCRTLVALATRMGSQPVMVNVDPREGLLSLPGTLSAAVYGAIMDVEEPACGFGVGSTPSSGPSAVPVKLPMVYYYGRERVDDDLPFWKELTGCLGTVVRQKMEEDEQARSAGLILDTPAVTVGGKTTIEMLAHAVREFSVDIVVVLGSARLNAELQSRLNQEHGENAVTVLMLDKSEGVAERDVGWMQFTREAAIKEYFFGDSKRTLSPFTQSVGFDELVIFKAPEESEYLDTREQTLGRAEMSQEMSHWTLAVMNASVNDPPDKIRRAPVMGFISIADVDEDRRRLKFLSPVSGRLGNRPLVWGRWPEPYINLLG
ncbi:inositol polyphosphate kinase-domain-containing protein [Diplogelasinospora grovesii]|uniref:Polynucleotide 5'-hydroxyl-kinase GRC3 n=1 Tax=Diplogelasinospora grovesii TaxID=303347 RepID=A0AAN6N8D1_9PEZI|nr:inositol polyphosphate kinase-domain-containing protein [Diplogelasinospora grovesii]